MSYYETIVGLTERRERKKRKRQGKAHFNLFCVKFLFYEHVDVRFGFNAHMNVHLYQC